VAARASDRRRFRLDSAPRAGGTAEREAEAAFLDALAIARRQQARTFELRAAMGLARLWGRGGKAREAHALLSESYGWFTEAFDAPDLIEAKALLAELAAARKERRR